MSTRKGIGAVGIITETAREALAKVAEFVEDGNTDVVIKDLSGNVLDRDGDGSGPNGRHWVITRLRVDL